MSPNFKHKELHERYSQQPEPKCKRLKFCSRIFQYGYTKEEAITSERYIFRAKRNQHIERDENGRVCNKCKQYKKREEFSYNRTGFMKRNPQCRECKNKAHREYRLNGGSEKDKQYRNQKRHLEIGSQIYFNSQIREVIEKKYNGYIVKNIVTEETKRISTSDNHYRPNNHCVRFQRLVENVQFVYEEEKEEKPKFELSLDPDEDNEEYYY